MSGTYIILFILFPAALVVGLGFIWLAPIITEKQPGHLYLGIRFDDESTLQFVDRDGANPLTRLDFFPQTGSAQADTEPLLSFDGLRRGKNIVGISDLPDGHYRLQFTSPGYRPLWVPMEKRDGEFRPVGAVRTPEGALVMEQFVGVELSSASTRR